MGEHVAIIGAGMAGAAAAHRLVTAGIPVTVFDKSRGVGGRMATRRADPWRIDHGAQVLTAHSADFQSMLDDWRADGHVAPWGPGYVGVPTMGAPVKALLGAAPVVAEKTVAALSRDLDGWRVHFAAPDPAFSYSAVFVAVPAPQVGPILASAGVDTTAPDRARYAPCWALLLGYHGPSGLGAPLMSPKDPIALAARVSTRPGRPDAEAVVVHADAGWSRAHLEDDKDRVAAKLFDAARAKLGLAPDPAYCTPHRWRYSVVEHAAGVPCVWDAAARVGAAGDWALGPRVEDAFLSGCALAEAYLATLSA